MRAASSARVRSATIVFTFGNCATAVSRFARSRETIATFAPSSRNARAQARPMPLLPPVTSTARPFSSRSMVSSTWMNSCHYRHSIRTRQSSERLREPETRHQAGKNHRADPVVVPERAETRLRIAIPDHLVMHRRQSRRHQQSGKKIDSQRSAPTDPRKDQQKHRVADHYRAYIVATKGNCGCLDADLAIVLTIHHCVLGI